MEDQRSAFVLEEAKLRSNLALIQSVALAANVEIILALKAYALWPSFSIIQEYLPTATASSLNEARLIQEHMGASPHIYAPAYLPEQFKEIARLASHLTFNSLRELERYRTIWENTDASVGLRVNPEYSPVQTALYNPGDSRGRLGETLPNLPSTPPVGLAGLHVHILCESSAEDTAALIRRMEQQFSHYLRNIQWLNLGGGHLMTKEGYDLEHLISSLRGLKERYSHLKIILEPGSAITWQAGYLKARVLDIVENYGQRTAMLDVSFTCHMPDTLEMPYRPVVRNASAEASEDGFAYRLGGVSCLAGDYLDNYWFKHPLLPGDSVIFEDMLHYTTVKTTMFNGVQHPDIIMLRPDGGATLIRRFNYGDYQRRMG